MNVDEPDFSAVLIKSWNIFRAEAKDQSKDGNH